MRTELVPLTLVQNVVVIAPGDLAIPFASDPVNGNFYSPTLNAEEILIAYNSGIAAHNLIINSSPDAIGREGDVTYSVPAGGHAIIQMSVLEGWQQDDGNIYLLADHAALVLAVVRHVDA